jgi:hypothetical protein
MKPIDGVTAIHAENLAGDIVGGRHRQKGNRPGDLHQNTPTNTSTLRAAGKRSTNKQSKRCRQALGTEKNSQEFTQWCDAFKSGEFSILQSLCDCQSNSSLSLSRVVVYLLDITDAAHWRAPEHLRLECLVLEHLVCVCVYVCV